MRVTFAGVGEAFDENLANTSLLVETDTSSILLDCGFTAASAFWNVTDKPLDLDALYITHFHGDHYFGIPALLVRSVEEGRSKRLTILGPTGIEDRVVHLMEMAYSNVMAKMAFKLFFVECSPDEDFRHSGFRFRFAQNDHSMPCLSIRLDYEGKSLFYSGDGSPTDATLALATGCNLIIHESYSLEPHTPGHGTVDSSMEFARKTQAPALALVHLQRKIRKDMKNEILTKAETADNCSVFLPEPGDIYEV